MRPFCVMIMEGTNCEDETRWAISAAGGSARIVHLKEFERGSARLEDFSGLLFPGGFSSGDYVRAGAIFAARLRSSIGPDLIRFVEEGKPVAGICNGFQILIELGLLPAFDSTMPDTPEATLATNSSGRFECRRAVLQVLSTETPFTSGYQTGQRVEFPVAHAEGRLLLKDEGRRDDLLKQAVFRYRSPEGGDPVYPWNPNGSPDDIAGIRNPAGNVVGLMPHPERSLLPQLHRDWTRTHREEGDGLAFFQAAVQKTQG